MHQRVQVAGVGMTRFSKPGTSPEYHVMAAEAARLALADAGLDYAQVQQVHAGYVYGDSTCGQRAVYGLGLSGIPVINVNNNCCTGSTALWLARQAVASGAAECAMALGFEKMAPGALGSVFGDRESPLSRHQAVLEMSQGDDSAAPLAARLFGAAAREYRQTYGIGADTFGRIAVKARAHAAHNPYALFAQPLTLEQVLASASVYDPLTRYQCCPPTCGAACAILCSGAFARRHGIAGAVGIAAQALTSDREDSFGGSMLDLVGYGMSQHAALQVYEAAGIGPRDVDVVELHDCFTANELISYEALGLCAPGEAERFILDGDNTYGGRVVTNPSGGLLSKGHPLGATGLAQCAELVWQLRGHAGRRQVAGARVGLQHNIGLGGACVVTMYQLD
ncbi:lipid-transfer protein [Xanthomonas hyacinthi]|uniref:propanoyl-CoA C-acyltransferase n=1 Tax=Xanthomonas hyacinthi TaxID=56455 RepID=A0A2S7EWF2_9XANT|nr:lipid-transfer protein [Xanthomonas hyacinthi]KLD77603.1 lipid-transfer protein [Xanthomonas hyacinthi DSM 19077]PPU97361.1 lipid-transfer protein [Xanthomonas hyacinthi]QGY76331.1 lipid-transfer protein [Xanthomonas hyacinthi]